MTDSAAEIDWISGSSKQKDTNIETENTQALSFVAWDVALIIHWQGGEERGEVELKLNWTWWGWITSFFSPEFHQTFIFIVSDSDLILGYLKLIAKGFSLPNIKPVLSIRLRKFINPKTFFISGWNKRGNFCASILSLKVVKLFLYNLYFNKLHHTNFVQTIKKEINRI